MGKSKTHCPKGHEFTPENTRLYTDKHRGYTWRMCRACDLLRGKSEKRKIWKKEWSRNHPDSLRNTNLKKSYGITLEQWEAIFNAQGRKCIGCGAMRPDQHPRQKFFHTDHNHVTGKIRGILCMTCNRVIGLAEENIARLLSLAEYLKKDLSMN